MIVNTAFNVALPALALVPLESDGTAAIYFFGFSLFFLGPIYYAIMYARYRNAKARHSHEKETSVEIANLQSYDQKVKTLRGISNPSLSGSNHTSVRGNRN